VLPTIVKVNIEFLRPWSPAVVTTVPSKWLWQFLCKAARVLKWGDPANWY